MQDCLAGHGHARHWPKPAQWSARHWAGTGRSAESEGCLEPGPGMLQKRSTKNWVFYFFLLQKYKFSIDSVCHVSSFDTDPHIEPWQLHSQASRWHLSFHSVLYAPRQPHVAPPLHSSSVQLPSACDLQSTRDKKETRVKGDKKPPFQVVWSEYYTSDSWINQS